MMSPEKLEALTRLRATFFRHPRHQKLEREFEALLQQRRAEIQLGLHNEMHGIAVVGASGSGKTTAIRRLIAKHPDLIRPRRDRIRAEIISFLVPSPATLKDVGMAALHALGYPLQRDRPAGVIWNRVRFFLQKRQTLFLHIDEAQDLYTVKSETVLRHVLNTLKSLMQNTGWPVGIILSGMPEIREMLNFDHQLSRRFTPIELLPVSYAADGDMMRELLRSYLNKAVLQPTTDVIHDDFLARLMHSGAAEFGLIIEILLKAIEEAYLQDTDCLEVGHFASAFRRRAGCIDGMNPFIASDFRNIDPRNLLNGFTPDPGTNGTVR